MTRLALAAARGDRAALEEFIRASQRDVWRFIAHLADVAHADDLTQETYLRALRSLSRFEGRSSARTWLLSIARRVVVDQIRFERARPRLSGDADWAAAAERSQARGRRGAGFEDLVEVNVLLEGLDDARREALVLTQILGLSYQQVAEVCGCELGTVRSRVARAREDLLAQSAAFDEGVS